MHPSDELDGGKWWTAKELKEAASDLTPNLRHELSLLGL